MLTMRHIQTLRVSLSLLMGPTLSAVGCGDQLDAPYVGSGAVVSSGSLDAGVPPETREERFEGLGSSELTTGVEPEPVGICAEGRPQGFERCDSGLDEDCDGFTDGNDDDCGEPEEEVTEDLCAGREGVTDLELLPLDSCIEAMLQARTHCHAMPGCTLSSPINTHGIGVAGTEACYGNGNYGIRLWTCSAEVPEGFRAL